MLYGVIKWLHVVGFALYGATVAGSLWLLARARTCEEASERNILVRTAAWFASAAALFAIGWVVLAGVGLLLAGGSSLLREPWMHAKLSTLLLALGAGHLAARRARTVALEPQAAAARTSLWKWLWVELAAVLIMSALAVIRPF